jgi:hypothetical protein
MREVKTDDRKMKIKKGEKSYTWYPASAREAVKFKTKMTSEELEEESEEGKDKEDENDVDEGFEDE